MPARTAYLGLGSNVGDRRAALQAAVHELAARGLPAVASSSTYETDPVGEVPDQPDFLNACVAVETDVQDEPLPHLALGLGGPVMRVEREPRDLDRDDGLRLVVVLVEVVVL